MSCKGHELIYRESFVFEGVVQNKKNYKTPVKTKALGQPVTWLDRINVLGQVPTKLPEGPVILLRTYNFEMEFKDPQTGETILISTELISGRLPAEGERVRMNLFLKSKRPGGKLACIADLTIIT